jgi:hypothetical protein
MKPENYSQRTSEVNGWPVRLTSYKLGDIFRCTADNVSPGACLARTDGATQEEAERKALARAAELLSRTRRNSVPPPEETGR